MRQNYILSWTIVNGTLFILLSASTQPTTTRFVLTSPSVASHYTRPNEVYSIGGNLWNEVEDAYKKNEGSSQVVHVYGAAKVPS